MAQSRLEKIGTIVTRTQGLLRSGAMKWDDRPLWYDIVTAFPPKEEPRYDRPAPNVTVRPIFYSEDKTRAEFYKNNRAQFMVNLADISNKTPTQHFIGIYQKLEAQGALDQERVFETAQELLEEKLKDLKHETITTTSVAAPVHSQTTGKEKTVELQDIFKD
ncbi:probable 28S ribosomal protein S23, mitochondrial [Toxorhynchites rutilus septentrionalis]|uniref:probable 28S ribosomal protein S23, mitochondrial n=1 Tax=Toxorhynchites rutilus septentrionalis TaxID=329112 RepID=UPI00247A989E|nr:probable 28S ribosomal protein S23, mitochondrial [Toxorhynchites rutilus septentrionalis]